MEGTYCVYFGKQPSGKIQITRQGLYYHLCCRCQLSGDVICRLVICYGNQTEALGIVVPIDDGFGLDTKIPVKRFDKNNPVFVLRPIAASEEGVFVPIYPDEPFAYIEKLKEAFLVRKYGQPGILV